MKLGRLREVRMLALAACLLVAFILSSTMALRSGSDTDTLRLERENNATANQVMYRGTLGSMLTSAQTCPLQFDGGDTGFSATLVWDAAPEITATGVMKIELHQIRGVFDAVVDTSEVPDNGPISAYWQKLDAGTYYVKLIRDNAKVSISAANVMFYWLRSA